MKVGFTHSFILVWSQVHKEFPLMPKDTFTLYPITILVPDLQFS